MEARANHIWVGIVTLVLLVAVAIGVMWLAQLSEGKVREFDILYSHSVGGLADGSEVSYSGVPVGKVTDIVVLDPEIVRVRIEIEEDVAILEGARASIQFSFTGVSTILIDGGKRGEKPLDCTTTQCTYGKPIIKADTSLLSQFATDGPEVLKQVSKLTDRLNQLLDDENQELLTGLLRNSNRMTAGIADAAPEFTANLRDFRTSIAEFNETMDALQQLTTKSENILTEESKTLSVELRRSLAKANKAADALTKTLEETKPVTDDLRDTTLPAAEATLQDLRSTSRSLRAITERLEKDGVGGLVGTPPLPDYEPKK